MALTRITKGVIKPNENYDTHNINSTGIVTAIGLDINGNGDVSGNLSVGGVLTYEDVTSIDSVGIITAKKDIHVGAGISVVGIVTAATFKGDGDFVDIDVDGHTNLDNVNIAGITTINGGKLAIGNVVPSKMLELYAGGTVASMYESTAGSYVEAQFKNSSRHYILGIRPETSHAFCIMDTTSGSGGILLRARDHTITLDHDLNVDGHTNLDNVSIAGITTGTIFKVPDATNVNGATNHIAIGDNSDLKLYHDNNGDAQIFNSTGHLTIVNNTAGRIINLQPKSGANGIIARYEGAAELYHNGNLRLNTSSVGVSIPQDLDVDGHTNLDNVSIAGVSTFSGDVDVNANIRGRNLVLDGNNGIKYIDADLANSNSITFRGYVGSSYQNMADFTRGGSCGLNFSGNRKLETSYTGVTVTGTVVATGADINGDLDVDGHTNLDNVSIVGVTTITANNVIGLNVENSSGGGAQTTIRSKSTVANASNFVRSESSDNKYIGLLKYGTGHSAYGALAAGGGAVYANSSVPITIMSDGGYINFATGGNTERLRIDTNGRLLVGHDTALNKFHGPYGTNNRNPQIQINGTNISNASLSITSWDNNVVGYYGAGIFLARSGSSTIGTNSRVTNQNTILGSIIFSGDDGTDFVKGAMIQGAVDNASGAQTGDNDMPGRLMFLTTADGAQEPTERARITSDGRLLMGVTTSQQGDANLQVFRAATTSRITFGNENVSASGVAGIDFCPSNKVMGSRIECQASEDFSSSANRTADLVFFTRSNGTSSEKLRIKGDGKFGIGDFSSGSVSQALHVKGSQPEIYLEHTGGYDLTFTTNDGAGNCGINPSGGALSLSYNNKNIWMCRTGGYVAMGHMSPVTRLDVKQNNGVAYNGRAQSVAYGAARFFNESGHQSGGTYTGFQFNLTGDSQNRICAIGMISEASNSRASSLVFATDDGGNRTEKLRITSDGVLKIERGSASNTALEINTTSTSNACRIKFNESGSNKAQIAYSHDNDRLEIVASSGNSIAFYGGGNLVSQINTSGHFIPQTNNTYDLGSTAKGWRNVYMNDLNLSNMNGNKNDIDGTQGSWTIQEGENDLFIINRLNGKKFKIKMEEIS